MRIIKPAHYDEFIAYFDPVSLTGLGAGRDDPSALLWALLSGDLARRYPAINSRLSWIVDAVEQYGKLRDSSSWRSKMDVVRQQQDSERFWYLLAYGVTVEEIRQIRTAARRAIQAHQDLQSSGVRHKSPASLRRRRKKAYKEYVRLTKAAVENGILSFGKSLRK